MSKLVEVTIDSIRVSLMSAHRVVILKDVYSERYLTIWIGSCEAEAITWELQEHTSPRPLTHDLLKNTIQTLGGTVTQIVINELRDDVYYARIVVDLGGGRTTEIDSRPSDAIALAVRVKVPIYVEEAVMDQGAQLPDQEVSDEKPATPATPQAQGAAPENDERLSVFKDFLDTLDLDDLEDTE